MSTNSDASAAPSLTFFFPYREVSGVPVLFGRMAMHLADECGIDARVVDYADGAMARQLAAGTRAQLIPFKDGVDLEIKDDTVLVMQAILPATMRPELKVHPQTRMLMWTLHPMNLVQTIVPVQWFRDRQSRSAAFYRFMARALAPGFTRSMRQYVEALARRDSIVFMDGVTFSATSERLSASISNPTYVPVPCEVGASNPAVGKAPPQQPLRVAWIGRLDMFKVHILAYTMRRLSDYAATPGAPAIRFHVVGEGPDSEKIEHLNVAHEKFEVIRHGALPLAELDPFLIAHVDVVAAMGTSAMEAAKLGIPTILLDIAYGPIRGDYLFRWFFESSNYSLGFLVTAESYQRGNQSIERMIDALLVSRAELSEKSFEYCRRFHSMHGVGERLMHAAAASSFRWHEIDPNLRRKTLVRRGFEFLRDRRRVGRQPEQRIEPRSTV